MDYETAEQLCRIIAIQNEIIQQQANALAQLGAVLTLEGIDTDGIDTDNPCGA